MGSEKRQRVAYEQETSIFKCSTRRAVLCDKLDERALKVLSAYNILHALPSQNEDPPNLKHLEDQIPMAFAGELSSLPSIQEAILSGKNAAYEIHNKLIK